MPPTPLETMTPQRVRSSFSRSRPVSYTHLDVYKRQGGALTDTYELEVEEELDERTPCYKVEFKAGGMEYEYKIDARTGGVLTYEMDRD